MIGFFKKLFEKEKWAVVKTYEINITDSDTHKVSIGTFYIHLSESSKGRRKAEPISTYKFYGEKPHQAMKRTEYYNTIIHRWLNGRNDPNIPRYSEIGEEDTVNYLRGKI